MAPGAQGGNGLGCQGPAAQGYSWGSEVAATNSQNDSSNKKYLKGKYKNSLSIYMSDLPTPALAATHSSPGCR